MSIKKTLLFLIIFVALGGYYYVVEVRMAEKKEVAEQAEKALFELSEADIQELSITRQHEEILITQQNSVWTLIEPVDDGADIAVIEGLLTQFTDAERARSIADTSSELAQFGLDSPELLVSVKDGENNTYTLRLGNKTPTTSEYYAQVNENSAVITVAAAIKTGLDKSLYDVRDKTVLAFEPSQIQQAAFTVNDPETDIPQDIVLHQENDLWTITAPRNFDADAAKMGSVPSTIKSAEIQKFVDETPDDIAQYGLDDPRAQLTLMVGNENERRTLVLGDTDEAETGIYAKHAATSTVFLVPPGILEEFPKGVNDLRDTTLLSYNSGDVQQIELLVDGKEPLFLEQIAPATEETESLWNIVQPLATPSSYEAMTSAVRSWLWDAQNLKVQQFVADEPGDLSVYGLHPPQVTLKIELADHEQPQELLLGHADLEQTGIYAKLGGQASVVLVKPEARKTLTRSINDLRDTQILTLMTDAIEKISIAYADRTLILEKKGDTWTSTEPEKQELTGYKVNNILYDIGALKFVEDIPAPDADLSVYGLDKPDVEITLWEKGRKDGMSIQIGTALEGRTEQYLKRRDVPTVYAIDAAFLDELPKSLADSVE